MARIASPLLVVTLALSLVSCASAQPVVRLGFLLPYPSGDSDIPVRLAQEWISAVRVSLEVLGKEFSDTFTVEPFVQNSDCNENNAAIGAKRLLYSDVVGVVGPACSEAVKGAASVLGPAGVPLISFAATADIFADSVKYPTVFRTSFGDQYQAQALLDVVRLFNFKSIYLIHTSGVYGLGLSASISELATANGITIAETVAVPFPPPADGSANYQPFIKNLAKDPKTIPVMITSPKVAENIYRAAYDLNKLEYPWWFLGSDGVVAFDLVGQGEDFLPIGNKLQGELGVAPYKGNYHKTRSPFNRFKSYWQGKTHADYPGLFTLNVEPKIEVARAYVTQLIDAVWTFYEAFKSILSDDAQAEEKVTAALVLECLRTDGCIWFKGASGQVYYNATTGERGGQPEYSIVNLIGTTYQEKTKWVEGQKWFKIDQATVMRPGPLPKGSTVSTAAELTYTDDLTADGGVDPSFSDFTPSPPPSDATPPAPKNGGSTSAPSSSSSSKPSAGAIAGLVIVILVAVAALGFGGWYLYQRRQRHPEHQEFVRML